MDIRIVKLSHGARLKCPCCSTYQFIRKPQAESPAQPEVRVYECKRCRWMGSFAGADDQPVHVTGWTANFAGTLLVITAVVGALHTLRSDRAVGFAAFF